MNWEKFDLGSNMKEDLIEIATNGEFNFQAEIVKKVNIYGRNLLSIFDIGVLVFDMNSNCIDKLEIKGLNANFNIALNQLNSMKEILLLKYVL